MNIFDLFKKTKKIKEPVTRSCMPEITVYWSNCCCVTIISTKDLSNVVLDLDEGYTKYDNLSGTEKTYCVQEGECTEASPKIKGVWVKSGCNNNDNPNHPCPEGQGCGEYFENPNYPCDEPTPEPEENCRGNTIHYFFGRNECEL